MKLSLCIATYNEEQNIHYPLDSVYDMVDEVIIVDGGSTDKTVEKAKSYGKKVKIISSPNPPMFHINKQKAIDAAKGEWILQLDADEALSKELKDEIKAVISNQLSVVSNEAKTEKLTTENRKTDVAFWLPRKNWFLTRFLTKGGQYPDYTIRLYRKGAVKFPLRSVHENVELIEKGKGGSGKGEAENTIPLTLDPSPYIGFLQNPILHYADPDFSRYLKRWDRYTSLDADLLYKSMKQFNNEAIYQYSNLTVFLMFLDYFILKPKITFFLIYFRHLGFLDGFPGFIFALFSAIRFWVIYTKLHTLKKS